MIAAFICNLFSVQYLLRYSISLNIGIMNCSLSSSLTLLPVFFVFFLITKIGAYLWKFQFLNAYYFVHDLHKLILRDCQGYFFYLHMHHDLLLINDISSFSIRFQYITHNAVNVLTPISTLTELWGQSPKIKLKYK